MTFLKKLFQISEAARARIKELGPRLEAGDREAIKEAKGIIAESDQTAMEQRAEVGDLSAIEAGSFWLDLLRSDRSTKGKDGKSP